MNNIEKQLWKAGIFATAGICLGIGHYVGYKEASPKVAIIGNFNHKGAEDLLVSPQHGVPTILYKNEYGVYVPIGEK